MKTQKGALFYAATLLLEPASKILAMPLYFTLGVYQATTEKMCYTVFIVWPHISGEMVRWRY